MFPLSAHCHLDIFYTSRSLHLAFIQILALTDQFADITIAAWHHDITVDAGLEGIILDWKTNIVLIQLTCPDSTMPDLKNLKQASKYTDYMPSKSHAQCLSKVVQD